MRTHVIQTLLLVLFCSTTKVNAQITINEGSNKNYSNIVDEDGDFPDWIELYNSGIDTVQLYNYSLTDDPAIPNKWTLPNIIMLPGEYKVIFCSDKNRKPISGFVNVLNQINYNPTIGWNSHTLSTPFIWDGVSSILLNTCSYSSAGYTSNSVFNQSNTPYYSTVYNFQDGSPNICQIGFGTKSTLRPNIKFNTTTIGSSAQQNSPTHVPSLIFDTHGSLSLPLVVDVGALAALVVDVGALAGLKPQSYSS
jgi:hypothetical protein